MSFNWSSSDANWLNSYHFLGKLQGTSDFAWDPQTIQPIFTVLETDFLGHNNFSVTGMLSQGN